MRYEDFRTGLTFRDVYELLRQEVSEAYEAGTYRFELKNSPKSTRRAVLGRWREIKLAMFAYATAPEQRR